MKELLQEHRTAEPSVSKDVQLAPRESQEKGLVPNNGTENVLGVAHRPSLTLNVWNDSQGKYWTVEVITSDCKTVGDLKQHTLPSHNTTGWYIICRGIPLSEKGQFNLPDFEGEQVHFIPPEKRIFETAVQALHEGDRPIGVVLSIMPEKAASLSRKLFLENFSATSSQRLVRRLANDLTNDSLNNSADWCCHRHPNNRIYYSSQLDQVRSCTVVTYDNIFDKSYPRDDLLRCATFFKHKLSQLGRSHWDLYLTLKKFKTSSTRNDSATWFYYLVDLSCGSLFWLEFIAPLPIIEMDKQDSFERIIEMNFLCHLESFPCHHSDDYKLPMDTLRERLIFTSTDHLTFPDEAMSAVHPRDCDVLLAMLATFDANSNCDANTHTPLLRKSQGTYEIWFRARVVRKLLSSPRIPYYGTVLEQTYPMNGLDESGPASAKSHFVSTLNMASFGILNSYAERLSTTWSDKVVTFEEWQNLLNSFVSDWADTSLLATVILSANMGFLALSATSAQDFETTCGIISSFFATGSIVVGMYHSGRHRLAQIYYSKDPTRGDAYFRNACNRGSIEMSGFVLGLPSILLMWSVVMFMAGLSAVAFRAKRPKVSLTFISLTLALTLVSLAAVMYIFGSMNENKVDPLPPPLSNQAEGLSKDPRKVQQSDIRQGPSSSAQVV